VNRPTLTDTEIAELVHDAAAGWTMPPVRLDAPAWRERVRSRRARRAEMLRGWLAPFGRAATGAVALTVAAGLIAVLITRPPNEPGKSPASTDGSTPRPTDAARPSSLPKLLANGDLPSPSEILVRTEPFAFAMVNLADGTIARPLVSGTPGSEVHLRRDGSFVCLCVAESGSAGGSPTTVTIRLDHLDVKGQVTRSDDIGSFTGAPDRRDTDRSAQDSLPNVQTTVSFSAGDAFGFVGWSYRAHPSWKSGLLVVELRTGEIVSRLDLPDVTDGEGNVRTVLDPPRVVGADGDQLIVGRSWLSLTSPSANPGFEVDAFRVPSSGGVLGEPEAVPGVSDCGERIRFAGRLPDGGEWLVCTRGETFQTTLRRIGSDGAALPDVSVTGEPGIQGDASVVSPDGRALFVLDPAAGKLTRVDTTSGETATGNGPVALADPGPLAALGRWLAPVAAAKSFLVSSVVLSPDGSRVYAIGVKDGVESRDFPGSAGVLVFDAASLELLDTYAPTADFVSIAIDPSGRFLYAAGLPGFDERGGRRTGQGASITVFDTTDGSVRLIAGQLGVGVITFGPEPLG
jgi:hypothetical protein